MDLGGHTFWSTLPCLETRGLFRSWSLNWFSFWMLNVIVCFDLGSSNMHNVRLFWSYKFTNVKNGSWGSLMYNGVCFGLGDSWRCIMGVCIGLGDSWKCITRVYFGLGNLYMHNQGFVLILGVELCIIWVCFCFGSS